MRSKVADILKDNKKIISFLENVILFFCISNLFGCFVNQVKIYSTAAEYKTGEYIFIGLSVLSFLAMCIISYKGIKAYKALDGPLKISPYIFAVILSFLTFTFNETCIQGLIAKYPIYLFMGYCIYLIPFLLGVAILKKPKIWNIIIVILFAIYGLTQHFVTAFRGSPAKFSDLQNVYDAWLVMDTYKLSIDFTIILALLQLAILILLIIKNEIKENQIKSRIAASAVSAVSLATFLLFTNYSYEFGVKNKYIDFGFTDVLNSFESGMIGNALSFYYDGVFNKISVPANYTQEEAIKALESNTNEQAADSAPIVIAILNESYADFSHVADFETNIDYIPYWRAMNENTIKGYVSVSAYGGGTCNSEFEFLTGNTMQFLPLGSTAFTTYVKTPQDSLVDEFNYLGYETIGLAPQSSNLWDVGRVYPLLGFKRTYFEKEIDIKTEVNRQPCDKELYEFIEKLISEKDKTKGLFIYATTMQNHAPYLVDFNKGLKLTERDVEAERYLNVLKDSDECIHDFLECLKSYDERIVVVMFGDHYPHLADFSKKLYGTNIANLETADYSRIQQTPFFIWSNKPLESKNIEDISLNYLGNELFKAADVPLTPYMQKLEQIREQMPIISGFGTKDKNGVWYAKGEETPYTDLLNEYQIIQYYRLFDEYKQKEKDYGDKDD